MCHVSLGQRHQSISALLNPFAKEKSDFCLAEVEPSMQNCISKAFLLEGDQRGETVTFHEPSLKAEERLNSHILLLLK